MNPGSSTVEQRSRTKLSEIRNTVNGSSTTRLFEQIQALPPEQQAAQAQKVWHGIISDYLSSGEPMPEDLKAECEVFLEAVFSGYAASSATSTVGGGHQQQRR